MTGQLWVTEDEEHYVVLLTTSRGVQAVCDCGNESPMSWASTDPALWALAHVGRAAVDA